MDVSYILSADELFTLMSLFPDHSEAGKAFVADALRDAKICGLDEPVKKEMAKIYPSGEIELSPIIRMLTDALAHASDVRQTENGWICHSPWITVKCDVYAYKEGHYKLTPIKD